MRGWAWNIVLVFVFELLSRRVGLVGEIVFLLLHLHLYLYLCLYLWLESVGGESGWVGGLVAITDRAGSKGPPAASPPTNLHHKRYNHHDQRHRHCHHHYHLVSINMVVMRMTMVAIMITKLGRRVAHVVTIRGVPEHLTKYFWWQLTKYSAGEKYWLLPVKGFPFTQVRSRRCSAVNCTPYWGAVQQLSPQWTLRVLCSSVS